jgi:hypothetical protein
VTSTNEKTVEIHGRDGVFTVTGWRETRWGTARFTIRDADGNVVFLNADWPTAWAWLAEQDLIDSALRHALPERT